MSTRIKCHSTVMLKEGMKVMPQEKMTQKRLVKLLNILDVDTDSNPQTVEALCLLLGNRLEPKAYTNKAFTPMQKLCITLRFLATGTHQMEVGDGEGASQASVSRIVRQVCAALPDKADDLVVFSLDPDILATVAKGFYGFSGSKLCYNFRWSVRRR